ncbi:MAG: YggS family pyridoxal phosphate-dependent enzyme, partial [bacterium]
MNRETEAKPGMTVDVAANLAAVRGRVQEACDRARRPVDGVTIVGITKTFGPDRVEALVRAGVTDIGENRVQELL